MYPSLETSIFTLEPFSTLMVFCSISFNFIIESEGSAYTVSVKI
jgi:hypothetical protein